MKKLLLLLIVSIAGTVNAQISDRRVHHVILTIDRSGFNPQHYYGLADTIQSVLNTTINQDRKLLEADDLFSMSYFCFEVDDNNCDNYITKYKSGNKPVERMKGQDVNFRRLWWEVIPQMRGINNCYSLISVARQFSLMEFYHQQPTDNRVFMILVTDRIYNGQDFYQELESLSAHYVSGRIINEFRRKSTSVQKNFFPRLISSTKLPDEDCYVDLYEYIPLQQYFAIESILNFQNTVTAQRQKNKYSVPIQIKYAPNSHFKILKTTIDILGGSDDNLLVYDSRSFENQIPENVDLLFDVPLEKAKAGAMKARITTWVHLNDKVYGAIVLHPYGESLQGANGLTRMIDIHTEERAKILGIFPLSDFLYRTAFWTESQLNAAIAYSILILVLILLLAILFICLFSRDNNPTIIIK